VAAVEDGPHGAVGSEAEGQGAGGGGLQAVLADGFGEAEEPEGATECPSCGFIYAKWRAAQAGTNTPVPVARKEEESSPVVLWGGLAAAVLAYVFFFRQPAPAPASEAAPRQALPKSRPRVQKLRSAIQRCAALTGWSTWPSKRRAWA